jgi:T5SS/PEP-CTERM-associated repeat protein
MPAKSTLTKSSKGVVTRTSLLFTGAVAAAVVLSGVKTKADDAADIEQFYAGNSYVQYDNTSGVYPIITAIASQPGTFGGHLYSAWSVLAEDPTGSLQLFLTSATLTTLTHNATTSISVGDNVSVAGQWTPFDQIPEITFSTVPASNNYYVTESSGNALPTPPNFTVSQLNVNNISNNIGMAGYFLEIQNATISGSTGSFQGTFPTFAQANTVSESYTITDNTGSMIMFDWVTSYSSCGALGGTAVPNGPIYAFGFVSYNPPVGPAKFTMLSFSSPNSWSDGTGKWETGTNWSSGVAPSLADPADIIANAGNNTVTIDATTATNFPNTLTINNLIIGAQGPMTNTLLLSNAGTNAPLVVFNSVSVDSGGSILLTNSALRVGGASGGALSVDGQLTMDSGTILVLSNLLVGPLNPLSLVTVWGGALYVTNAAHNAVTEVRYGTLVLTGGVYFTDSLLLTNTGASFINDGGAFVITGLGQVDQGTQTLASGTTQLSSNLVVGSSANSTGTISVIGGQLVVTNGVIGIGNEGTLTSGGGVGLMIVSNGTVLASQILLGSSAGGHGDLTIQTNGVVSLVGTNATLVCNDMYMNGGLLSMTNGTLYCGQVHPGSMIMSNGTALCQTMYVGYDQLGAMTMYNGIMMIGSELVVGHLGGSTGQVSVAGGQLLLTNVNNNIIGNGGPGQLTVSNGSVLASEIQVGGTGMLIDQAVGGPGGTLSISGGTVALNAGLDVGTAYEATGAVWVTGGQLLVTNGAITVGGNPNPGSGQFVISNGLVQAKYLVITNGAVFTLSSGTLSCGDPMSSGLGATMASNDMRFVVGNGTNIATFNLLGVNYHTFSKGLEANTNSYLFGCGTINGNVLVDKGGTIVANCGGKLTLTGIVTNNGTMRAINGSVLEFYEPVVNNGLIDIIGGNTNFHSAFTNINNGAVVNASYFQVVHIAKEGNGIRVTWNTVGGLTNVLQVTAGGSYSNNFSDLSSNIVVAGFGQATTNYLDVGGATNFPARYYRVRLVP